MADTGIACVKNERNIEIRDTEPIVTKKRQNRHNFIHTKKMCHHFMNTGDCSKKDSCRFLHSVESFLEYKEPLIDVPCVNFLMEGKCHYGISCRLKHDNIAFNNSVKKSSVSNIVDSDIKALLRRKQYNFKKSIQVLKQDEKEFSDPEIIKKIDFCEKLYLAPLTTVGNLPFRRICKEFGADITCSEMILATSLLQGKLGEWALLKRHASETIFGAQIAGSQPEDITKAAELINDHTDVDFIDLNCGCPIDLICNKGAGCSLMTSANKLSRILTSLLRISRVPITVKMRTGIKDDVRLTHKLIQPMRELGVSAITIHGRSRHQRYTKLADWSYIQECSLLSDVPIIGNGDIMSYDDFTQKVPSSVTGIMIGRGALIKPWIFTEIKEHRLWDISSSERFDIIKKYVNYGFEHWGTDTEGLEKTRNFLLEWLSFLYRYVPVGILEHPPQRINQRPQPFFGRDELETLFASPDVNDWIKITSMFLGNPKEGFSFVSKHKSKSYG